MLPFTQDQRIAFTHAGGATPDLCIVVPAHNEEANLPLLYRELAKTLNVVDVSFTLIVVDDGSRDGTAEVVQGLAREHGNVAGLRLSRNFGHQTALSVGLSHARGRAIGVMDADLQDRPSDLLLLYRRWQEGADVVYAVRRSRREHILKRAAYRLFYRLLARLSYIKIPLDSGDFCVMDASFVTRLNGLPERLRFVRGLRAWLGGVQVGVPVDRDARRTGVPTYNLTKLVRFALDGLVSFSSAPLTFAAHVGMIVSCIAGIGMLLVIAWKIMGKLPTGAGTATIALSVLFLSGVQLLSIGILGEYVGRIFEEVKRRPVGVVTEVLSDAPARSTGHREEATGARARSA
ncbi:MAG TPA: glycosyltransferase family 2 protein [Gemmatimonadaceae bacterium]|nr:glycosyltransferase family 2 protein [Gemmatimonadaceae bacterium]